MGRRNAPEGIAHRDSPRPPDSHRRFVPRNMWLEPDLDRALRAIAADEGISATEWVRRAIRARTARRASEAHDYVRRVVPEAVARAAERELTEKAEFLLGLAKRHAAADHMYARRLRSEAGVLLERAAWFADVVSAYGKLPPSGVPNAAGHPTRPGGPRPPDNPGPTLGAPSSQ